jgi:hypothetical protein
VQNADYCLVINFLCYSSILKMETVCSSEIFAKLYQTPRPHVPQSSTLHTHCRENLQYYAFTRLQKCKIPCLRHVFEIKSVTTLWMYIHVTRSFVRNCAICYQYIFLKKIRKVDPMNQARYTDAIFTIFREYYLVFKSNENLTLEVACEELCAKFSILHWLLEGKCHSFLWMVVYDLIKINIKLKDMIVRVSTDRKTLLNENFECTVEWISDER